MSLITIPPYLPALVAQVAHEDQEAREAHEAQTAAEVALLDRLVEILRPALRAIGTRQIATYRLAYRAQVGQYENTTRTPWRGVWVAGESGAEEDHSDHNDGAYIGRATFLDEDGVWRTLTYQGTWSRWQGSTSAYDTREQTLTTAEVAKRTDVALIVERLIEAVEKAKGSRAKGMAAARQAAERARAALALLNGQV